MNVYLLKSRQLPADISHFLLYSVFYEGTHIKRITKHKEQL